MSMRQGGNESMIITLGLLPRNAFVAHALEI